MSDSQQLPTRGLRPRILAISFSPLRQDARVLRQLSVLAEFGDVVTVGYGAAPDGVHEHIEVPSSLASLPQTPIGVLKLVMRRFRGAEFAAPALQAARRLLTDRRFDLVVVNDARALPLAFDAASGAPVWADMHEWAPEEQSNILSWRLLVSPFMTSLCREYLPRCAVTTTVSSPIAEMYEKTFGVRPAIVRNARDFVELLPSSSEPGRIRLVHSGIGVRGRGIETLIDAVLASDSRFTLDLFLLFGEDYSYRQQLVERAAGSVRIRFNEPVPPDALPATLNAFDLGVFMLRPVTANYRFMLPNKFFDFVQARLGVLFSRSVETDRLIREYGLGLSIPGFDVEDLTRALSSLTSEAVLEFKRSADTAARALSYETDAEVQRGMLSRLLPTQ